MRGNTIRVATIELLFDGPNDGSMQYELIVAAGEITGRLKVIRKSRSTWLEASWWNGAKGVGYHETTSNSNLFRHPQLYQNTGAMPFFDKPKAKRNFR